MKKQTAIESSKPDTPKPAAVPAAAPAYDRLAAVKVTPRRHEATARTVCRVQPAGDKAHLFSYAGDFIATVTAKQAEAYMPAPKPTAAAEAAPAAS